MKCEATGELLKANPIPKPDVWCLPVTSTVQSLSAQPYTLPRRWETPSEDYRPPGLAPVCVTLGSKVELCVLGIFRLGKAFF